MDCRLGFGGKGSALFNLQCSVSDQERSLVTVVAHTTSARGGRFEVPVRTPFLRAGVFDAQNLVTIPEAKLIRRVGTPRAEDLALVENSVRSWLGL